MGGEFFAGLPEGFVSKALSLTSPRDASRLSSVCCGFRSAAEWDALWETFLPENYEKMIADDDNGGEFLSFSSKKELYLKLCDRPLLIDGGNKSFWLDKGSGKKCYMLGARDLSIVWGDTPRYWRWISVPDSRFAEVAELISVCWFEVQGRMETWMLSPNTAYVACIVFKSTSETYGFEHQPTEVSVGLSGVEAQRQTVFLEPDAEQRRRYPVVPRRRMGMMFNHRGSGTMNHVPVPVGGSKGNGPKLRRDGWLEIELGEYYVKAGEAAGELEMSMTEVKGGNWKGGLIIQGIEIRPKSV